MAALRTVRFVLWALVAVVLVTLGSAWFLMRAPERLPEVVTAAPDFTLTDETGQSFSSADLAGQVYVVQFFFTSCTTVCPRLTDWMTKIQDRIAPLGDGVRMVSISVDPRRDTPEKLAVYAKGYGAVPGFWKFLTGDPERVEAVVVDGFFQVMDEKRDETQGVYDIVHSERFVVVDQEGRVRGYYDADQEGVDRLVGDVRLLVERGP
jgi:protein SCO1/2